MELAIPFHRTCGGKECGPGVSQMWFQFWMYYLVAMQRWGSHFSFLMSQVPYL